LHLSKIGRIKFLSVSDQGMLPKSHSCLGRKRLGRSRQVPRHWQASLRQDLYPVVTGSVLGFPSASLLVLSQLECPVSFFGAASTSAPPYKQTPGTFAIAPFGRLLRPAVAYRDGYSNPPIPGDCSTTAICGCLLCDKYVTLALYVAAYDVTNM
jgi:hypothetical protein